jgi:hypothetical protein
MNIRSSVLGAYSLLLRFYPSGFRQRFGPEMLELAETAEPAEWPLIFGDTSVAIVRSWIEGSPSTTALTEPNAYLAIGGAPLRGSALIHGLVVSIVLIAGFSYASYRWPPPCPKQKQILTPIVSPPQTRVKSLQSRPIAQALPILTSAEN